MSTLGPGKQKSGEELIPMMRIYDERHTGVLLAWPAC